MKKISKIGISNRYDKEIQLASDIIQIKDQQLRPQKNVKKNKKRHVIRKIREEDKKNRYKREIIL